MKLSLIAICLTALCFLLWTIVLKLSLIHRINLDKRLENLLEDKKDREKTYRKKSTESNHEEGPLKKMLFFVNKKNMLKVEDLLSMAAVPLKAEEYLAIWVLAITAIPSLILFFDGNKIVCLGFSLLGAMIPPMVLSHYTRKRRNLFKSQLADAMNVMCNSLQTGFSFQVALKSVAEEMPDPVANEFLRIAREMQLGMSIEDSLDRMVDRTKCEDLELLSTTLAIQKQTGGNLSEILQCISQTIRERIALTNEIKLLTTTGRTSGYVIGLLPVFILIGLMILNPEYISVFFETSSGKLMLLIAIMLELIGFIVVKKVMDIKY